MSLPVIPPPSAPADEIAPFSSGFVALLVLVAVLAGILWLLSRYQPVKNVPKPPPSPDLTPAAELEKVTQSLYDVDLAAWRWAQKYVSPEWMTKL